MDSTLNWIIDRELYDVGEQITLLDDNDNPIYFTVILSVIHENDKNIFLFLRPLDSLDNNEIKIVKMIQSNKEGFYCFDDLNDNDKEFINQITTYFQQTIDK